jgi:hypothetical protein
MLTDEDQAEIERSLSLAYLAAIQVLLNIQRAKRIVHVKRPRTTAERHVAESGHELRQGCCAATSQPSGDVDEYGELID